MSSLMRRLHLFAPALILGLLELSAIMPARVLAQQPQNPPNAASPAPAGPATRHANDGRAPGVIELMNQVEDLQSEINRLRGQLEVLSNGLENAQKRQRDMYLDLDTRVRRIEQGGNASTAPRAAESAPPPAEPEARAKPPTAADVDARLKRIEQQNSAAAAGSPPAAGGTPPATTTQTVPAPTPPTTPARPTPPASTGGTSDAHVRKAYDVGLAAYRSGDYQGAIAAFDGIVKRYPRDTLAANAQYWIGDARFNLRDFKSAASAQQTLINNYPDSPKVPDAMLNLGSAYAALGDGTSARRAWEDLIARYPQADAAEKARQRLARLK
jgi:tol-pal system protein YbgF